PTLRRCSLAETSDEPPSTAGIRGISACKVYPRRRLPDDTVGSYPTFSSSPPMAAVIFCGTCCERLRAPRRLTGTLPYAVRTFLPLKTSDDPVGSNEKNTIKKSA